MSRILSNTSFMKSVNLFRLLTVLSIALFWSLPLFGQNEANVDCGSVAKLSKPKGTKIVSLGVLNGKAIDLVKPKFPSAAKAVNAHGSVEISILIDPRGCVTETKVLSGHPLLIASSLSAARKSTFSPVTLSGKPIWVYGIIVYNYIPDSLNWFELGLVSDSLEKLNEYLPSAFELQRSQLRNIKSLPFDERQKATVGVLDSIHANLATEPKQQWLFDVGREINDISKFNWTGRDGLNDRVQALNQFLQIAPEGVSPKLVEALKQLTAETDTDAFWTEVKIIDSRSFYFGM